MLGMNLKNASRTAGSRRVTLSTIAALVALAPGSIAAAPADNPPDTQTAGLLQRWETFQELPLPTESTAALIDFVLTPSVFDKARVDLGDLRLYDAKSREVHYALRIRRPVSVDQTIAAREFNRAVGPNDSSEVTLDLGADAPEHNAVEVELPDLNFRRRAQLEGSADGQEWKTIVESKNLVHFRAGDRELDDRRVVYPPSRFRYLRLRVYQDPQVDKKPVEQGAVTVHRKTEVPGEFVTLPARLEPREPVAAGAGPGSAWMIDLGGTGQPCQKILVEIADPEFARDYRLEAVEPEGSWQPFEFVASAPWSRRAGDALRPLTAEFGERTAARLRLVVTDYRNPPLDLRSVEFVAPSREVVFARDETLQGPLRLYYGNPLAEPPHYDLERNLPAQLEPPPERLGLGLPQQNPDYLPAPLPLTERLPWLIYVVLGTASLLLALVILSLGRVSLALHDAR